MLSYIIYKLAIQKRDIRIIIAALLIFMFYPSIQIFALSMLKDGIWAAFVGCFELQLIDAAEYYKENPKKEKVLEYIKLFIFALGVALFRNNGIYLLLFSAPSPASFLPGLLLIRRILLHWKNFQAYCL